MRTTYNGILLVLTVIFLACCTSKPSNKRFVLKPGKADLTWRGDYDQETHRMTYLDKWAGCGWWFGDDSTMPSGDFSDYDQLVVDVDSIVGDSVTLFLNARYTNTDIISSGTAPIVNGRTTLRLDLDPEGKSHILEVYVMSKYPCELTLLGGAFRKAIQYGRERKLRMHGKFIEASEFDGYSDDALVSFKFFADGEMTYMDTDSGRIAPMNNWGIGVVCSSADPIEAVCPGRRIILKKIGEQSFDCRLGDIRYMLDLEDDDGEHGLYWNVWKGGNLTDVHMLNTTIREAIN